MIAARRSNRIAGPWLPCTGTACSLHTPSQAKGTCQSQRSKNLSRQQILTAFLAISSARHIHPS